MKTKEELARVYMGWHADSESVTATIARDAFIAGFDAGSAEIAMLREMVKAAREGLEYYAQRPTPESGTEWSNSCAEWGIRSMTWDPLTDLGGRARATLARLDEMEGDAK